MEFDLVEDNRVGHLTDTEGNLGLWHNYIKLQSGVFRQVGDRLELLDGASFVFGGDLFDKCDGDLRLARELVELKDRYPTRVFFLLGNRDVNKMKLSAEVDPDEVRLSSVDEAPVPYWVTDESKRVTARMYIDRLIAADASGLVSRRPSLCHLTGVSLQSAEEALANHNTAVNRLKFLLTHTMGCETTFELRRRELSILEATSPDSISDEAVHASFLSSVCSPDGAVRRVLQRGQLAACVGDTLFVHGGVTRSSMAFVPADDTQDRVHEVKGTEMHATHSVQQWIDSLNEWARRSMRDWEARPTWQDLPDKRKRQSAALDGKDCSEGSAPEYRLRGGQALMAYGYEAAMKGRTVMVSTYFNNGQPVAPDPVVAAYLARSGVTRVVVGHKPFGDSPTFICSGAGARETAMAEGAKSETGQPAEAKEPVLELEVISADTSYSDPRAPDHRGRAVSALCVHFGRVRQGGSSAGVEHEPRKDAYRDEWAVSWTTVRGVLHDGQEIEFTTWPRFARSEYAQPGAGEGKSSTGTPPPAELQRRVALRLGADRWIGRCVGDGWWVKAKLCTKAGADSEHEHVTSRPIASGGAADAAPAAVPADSPYLLSKGNGRRVDYRFVSEAALVALASPYARL